MVVKNAMDHLNNAHPKNVNYVLEIPDTEIHAQLSVPLFECI